MITAASLVNGMTRHGWTVEPTRDPARVDARVSYQGATDRLILEHRGEGQIWLWMISLDEKRCVGLGDSAQEQALDTIAAMQDEISVDKFFDVYLKLQKVCSPAIMAWEQFQKGADGLSESYGVELLFEKTPTLAYDAIESALAAELPGVRRLAAGHWALPSGSELAVRNVSAPRPFQNALAQTWNWGDAQEAVEEVKQAVLVTDLVAGGVPRAERAANFFKLLRVVLAEHSPAAIHWIPSQRLVDPEWLDSVPAGKEFLVILNIRYFRSPPFHFMDTRGLDVFGLPDLECRFIDFEPGQMSKCLGTIARYLWDKGDVFEEPSDTMDGMSDEPWTILHELSSMEPVRVVLKVVAGRNAIDSKAAAGDDDGHDDEDAED